ncbi:MAG: hypothetical protein IT359_06195 [Gemmatimonadaceae bacterium]|nr:hypothetical protein [Gemmatimonadaceae bacterium]
MAPARHVGWLVVALLAVSCRRPAPPPPTVVHIAPVAAPPISPWPGTLANALRAAEAGKFDDAEGVLSQFSVEHAGTPDGAESDFWRALLKTDPNNRKATPRESMALYDAYLSGGPSMPRYAEAQMLRRVVEALDSTRTLVSTLRASFESRDKGRDDEIRRLNDALDRTTAELERIKRRLTPKPQ